MKNILVLLLLLLCVPAYADQEVGASATTLNGQAASYYLSRANHTGTQADSTLNTITTAGKVSGASITSGTIAGSAAVNTTGWITSEGFITGSLEGTSISVVQLGNTGIVDNDTDTIVFPFVPSRIVVNFSGRSQKITSGELGGSVGNCIITITGTNKFESNTNWADFYAALTVYTADVSLNDTTNIIRVRGGDGAGGSAYFLVRRIDKEKRT